MNTDNELGRTLRERADSVTSTPLTFDDVRGRARRIRRRQAAGVAGGLALVAAVALPIALLGGTGGGKADPQPASPSPTRAVDVYAGGVPTLQDGVIIYQDGPRIPLPGELRDNADGFAVLRGDRYLVTQSAGDGREAVLIDDRGGLLDRFPIDSGIAVGSDTSVAWVGPDRTLQLLVPGSDEPRAVPVDGLEPSEAAAVTGDCADECTIAVRTRAGGDLGSTTMVTSRGDVTTIDENVAVPAVVDVSSDGALLAGLDAYAPDDIHTCGGVYDVAVDDYAWRSCEDNVYDFSPSGDLVATTFSEGLGPTRIDVRDSDSGELVIGITGGTITSWAWEDDAHLLVVQVMDNGETSVRRLSAGLDDTALDGFHTDDPTLSVPVQLPLG